MGVVCPAALDSSARDLIHAKIILPTLRRLQEQRLLYRGVIYFGLMLTEHGPSLLEYNVRFGDPEAQAILPLIDGDWGIVFKRLAAGELTQLKWKKQYSACVVLASPGYPDSPKSVLIDGDLKLQTRRRIIFCTPEQNSKTTGGQRPEAAFYNAMGIGKTLQAAIDRAYEQAVAKVRAPGMQMRRDIG